MGQAHCDMLSHLVVFESRRDAPSNDLVAVAAAIEPVDVARYLAPGRNDPLSGSKNQRESGRPRRQHSPKFATTCFDPC